MIADGNKGESHEGMQKIRHANIWPPERICRLLASAGLMLLVSAATRRAQAKDVTDWVPVSMNAGETYVINDIKPGIKPSFQVRAESERLRQLRLATGQAHDAERRSRAAGSLPSPTTSDREVSYDVNAFAAAKPGAPLTPGKAPPSMSDDGLELATGRRRVNLDIRRDCRSWERFRRCARLRRQLALRLLRSVTIPDKAPVCLRMRRFVECAASTPDKGSPKPTSRANRLRRWQPRAASLSKRSVGAGFGPGIPGRQRLRREALSAARKPYRS